MKKFMLVLIAVMMMAGTAIAADVVLTVTVPDNGDNIARVHAAVQGFSDRLGCEGETPADSRDCLENYLKQQVIKLVKKYERQVSAKSITEIPTE